MKAYLLRNVPSPLWQRVRARASKQGLSLRAVLILLLERYAAQGLD